MTGSRNCAADRRPRSARAHGPAARVIEGEAVLVNRRSLEKPPRDKAAAFPARQAMPEETAPPRLPASVAAARQQGPRDLVFQGPLPARCIPPDRPAGLSIFGRRPDATLAPAVALAAAALGLILVPAILLGLPQAPAAAPLEHEAIVDIVLTDVSARLAPRGSGEVLSVEGMIHNAAGETSLVPTLRIVLADDAGIVYSKPMTAAVRALEPGESIRFQSAVAVPAGTSGDLSVEFRDEDRQR